MHPPAADADFAGNYLWSGSSKKTPRALIFNNKKIAGPISRPRLNMLTIENAKKVSIFTEVIPLFCKVFKNSSF
jgi:hypothetical protein